MHIQGQLRNLEVSIIILILVIFVRRTQSSEQRIIAPAHTVRFFQAIGGETQSPARSITAHASTLRFLKRYLQSRTYKKTEKLHASFSPLAIICCQYVIIYLFQNQPSQFIYSMVQHVNDVATVTCILSFQVYRVTFSWMINYWSLNYFGTIFDKRNIHMSLFYDSTLV